MSEAAVGVATRWAGGVCPFDAGWKKVMMWVFIITDGLLFAGFLAAYGYARLMSGVWPDQTEVFSLPFIAAMTFVLITSSATMATAVWASETGQTASARRYVTFTLVGGLTFLGMQAYEWTHFIGEGARLASNPWGDPLFAAYFFLLTGFHGSHVLTGLIVLTKTVLGLSTGKTPVANVEMAGLYWHFVDLVWVFIFTFFYLI
ncbi:MAG: cytochrome c oxidase subunit 3 [Vicinamibacterales bacterium]|jgi:cytochrome c oxidase subunit 3|nr:cytochrome c oxidase subunit 3 [Vicinamibacterales bacterium]